MDTKNLPPLPPSDPASMQRNHYDGFYGIRAREYWGQAEVSQNEVKPFQTCDHYFIQIPDGVECKQCHIGWTSGSLKAREGKLIVNGETISMG